MFYNIVFEYVFIIMSKNTVELFECKALPHHSHGQ